MIQIEVRGFQSIDRVQLDINGFTALVGRSNIGKSAVIRALKCALTNSPGTSFVRHGEQCARVLRDAKTCKCVASVGIQSDGFDFLWEKGDSVNRYTFNKSVYDKPGQGIPEFLLQNGFSPVKVGDDSKCIQIADQFFPIFLLNESGPSIAESISDVARLDRINKASKRVEKERREAVATKKVREADVTKLRSQLEAYATLDDLLEKASLVESRLVEVEVVDSKVRALEDHLEAYQDLTHRVYALTVVDSMSVPDLEPVTTSLDQFSQLVRFDTEMGHRVQNYGSIKWVEKFLATVPDLEPVQVSYDSIRKVDSFIIKLRYFKSKMASLGKVEGITLQPIEDITQVQKKIHDLSRLVLRFDSLSKAISKLEGDLQVAESDEQAVVSESDALGICPACTQPIDVGHTHA